MWSHLSAHQIHLLVACSAALPHQLHQDNNKYNERGDPDPDPYAKANFAHATSRTQVPRLTGAGPIIVHPVVALAVHTLAAVTGRAVVVREAQVAHPATEGTHAVARVGGRRVADTLAGREAAAKWGRALLGVHEAV